MVRMTAHEMVIGLELMMVVDLLGSMLAEVSHRYVSCMIRQTHAYAIHTNKLTLRVGKFVNIFVGLGVSCNPKVTSISA